MNTHSTEKLADLISKRLACLKQLRAIGHKQAELIAASEISTLLRLISAKQQLITALQAIEQELAPYRSQDAEARQWASPALRQQCAQQAEECRQLLEEVMKLEKANEQQMTHRRNEVESRLQSAATAGKARNAYQIHQNHRQQAPPVGQTRPADLTMPTSSLDVSTNA